MGGSHDDATRVILDEQTGRSGDQQRHGQHTEAWSREHHNA